MSTIDFQQLPPHIEHTIVLDLAARFYKSGGEIHADDLREAGYVDTQDWRQITMNATECFKCGADAKPDFNFCPLCGVEKPSRLVVTWDWKEQPGWGRINEALQPFGCKIVEIETNSDEYAVYVEKL